MNLYENETKITSRMQLQWHKMYTLYNDEKKYNI